MDGTRPGAQRDGGTADPRLRRALQRARWNTTYVRTLRIAFPCIALALAGAYGFVLSQNLASSSSGSTAQTGLSFDGPIVSAEGLGMSNPRYEGFDKEGNRYVVSARKAISDLRSQGPISLETIEGELFGIDKRITRLEATRGLYTRETGELKLADGIVVTTSDGMVARLVTAEVEPKSGLIRSGDPVDVEMPSAKVVGRTLNINQRARTITFGNGVVATLTPQVAAESQRVAPPTTPAGVGFALDNRAPIKITSTRLDIDDTANQAVFVTDVRAVQDNSSLTAARLEVSYEGTGGPAGAETAGPIAGAAGERAIKSVTAHENVVLRQGTEQVSAERADFDPKAQTALLQGTVRVTSPRGTANADRMQVEQATGRALLEGNVVVRQDQNTFAGRRLELDQQRGWLRLTSPADGATPPGVIETRFVSNANGQQRPGQRHAQTGNAANGAAAAPFSFHTDTTAPIDVAAAQLEVDDQKKVAVYQGDVRAKQGPFSMSSRTLTATYAGSTAVMSAATPSPSDRAAGAAADLRELTASGDVMIASGSQRARGDTAIFDVPGDSLELRGNVTLIDGRQVLKGDVLYVDMKTGISRLKAGAKPGTTAEKNGRMRAVFFPVDLMNARREQQKQGRDPKPDPSAPSGWSATTAPNTN